MADEIGFEVHLGLPYAQAIEKVTAALKAEGFGILTEIDVRATMQEKLGVEFRPYAILGASNPALAYRSLSQDALTGQMLPCNVTVEHGDAGGAIIRFINPEVMLAVGSLREDPILSEVASQARERLERAARALAES